MLFGTACAIGLDPGGMNPPARWGDVPGALGVASRGFYTRGIG